MSTTDVADWDLLTDVLRHSEVLTELQGEGLTREALERSIDVSSATCYRYTNRLGELDLVAVSGEEITLTPLGQTIARELAAFERAVSGTLSSGADNQEVIEELLRHSPGLQAISRRPLDRRELEDRLGVSETTGYRITSSLEDRDLIEKGNGRYEITATGEEILDAVSEFESNVQTATRLGPLLRALRESGHSVDLDAFAGATATTRHRYTHGPQTRCLDLLEETDTLRCIALEPVVPGYLVYLQERINDGLEFEIIKGLEAAAEMLAEYPEEAIEACNSDNVSVYLHDDLRFSLAIFDDRIGIGVLDPETRSYQKFVDTDAPAARTWAEAVYESYKEEAVHLPRFNPFSLQQVAEQMQSETGQHVEQR